MEKIFDFNLFHKAQKKAQSRASSLVGFLLKKIGGNQTDKDAVLPDSFMKEAQKVFYETERYLQNNNEELPKNDKKDS